MSTATPAAEEGPPLAVSYRTLHLQLARGPYNITGKAPVFVGGHSASNKQLCGNFYLDRIQRISISQPYPRELHSVRRPVVPRELPASRPPCLFLRGAALSSPEAGSQLAELCACFAAARRRPVDARPPAWPGFCRSELCKRVDRRSPAWRRRPVGFVTGAEPASPADKERWCGGLGRARGDPIWRARGDC